MKLPTPLSFEWDEGNKDKNWQKHKVYYKEAEEVFINEPSFLKDKKHSQDEDRFVALGKTSQERFLYIVFTIRGTEIRIISARDQSKKERKMYGEK